MKKLASWAMGLTVLAPAWTFAALGSGSLKENMNADGTTESLSTFLKNIQGWLLGIVGGLAVLFIVYGGLLYVTSGGNKEKIETARKTLTYAIGGLLLVVLSGLIFEVLTGGFLTSIFGTKTL